MKSHDRRTTPKFKRQRLDANFRGTESLFAESGFVPRAVGAICQRADFTDILEVPSGVLGRNDGKIVVDLVEPGKTPEPRADVVLRKEFQEATPWLVVSVLKD